MILYSFYKNIVLTFILFYYLFFTGFSGQSLFEDWVYSGCVYRQCICMDWRLGFVSWFASWVLGLVSQRTPRSKPQDPSHHPRLIHPRTTPPHTLTHRFNFFLAMPIICVGFFDTDIRPSNVLKWKWVYMSGRDRMDLNVKLMAQWFGQVRACLGGWPRD